MRLPPSFQCLWQLCAKYFLRCWLNLSRSVLYFGMNTHNEPRELLEVLSVYDLDDHEIEIYTREMDRLEQALMGYDDRHPDE